MATRRSVASVITIGFVLICASLRAETQEGPRFVGTAFTACLGGREFLISRDGRMLSEVGYDEIADTFMGTGDPVLPIRQNGKWGYISITGKRVAECKYDSAREFVFDLTTAKRDGKWWILNQSGEEVKPLEGEYSYVASLPWGDFVGFGPNWEFRGLFSSDGALRMAGNNYERVTPMSRTRIRVQAAGKYGVVEPPDRVVIPIEYDNLIPNPRIVIAVKDHETTILDPNGRHVFNGSFDSASLAGKDLLLLELGNRYSLCDFLGNVLATDLEKLITTVYLWQPNVEAFPAKKDGFWGFLGFDGKWLIEPKYLGVSNWAGGAGMVEDPVNPGIWVLVTKGGSRLLSLPRKTWIRSTHGEAGWLLSGASLRSVVLVSPAGDASRTYDEVGLIRYGYASVRKGKLWGVISPKGLEVAPAKYETAYALVPGIIAFTANGLVGLLDEEGKVLCEPKFERIREIKLE
ncbi:MAG: WG repeat-containing protein [Candidatus Brocadiia bacterium]